MSEELHQYSTDPILNAFMNNPNSEEAREAARQKIENLQKENVESQSELNLEKTTKYSELNRLRQNQRLKQQVEQLKQNGSI